MPDILLLETATRSCSVSLARNGEVICSRESTVINSHSAMITVFIDEVLTEASIKYNDLHAVAVSKGPGSYTGLRIGVSTAKGLCYALDIPLISVGTLKSMAAHLKIKNNEIDKTALLCPMIDARRMEVYSAIFDNELNEVEKVSAKIIDESSFRELLDKNKIYVFGDGSEKCESIIGNHPNSIFVASFEASSFGMAALAQNKFDTDFFEDLAYFEPFYLKDFVATVPKNNIIGQ
jgi:tRNA threonylcarbamoyladenosine biosynthesis protein TsaB